MSPAAPAAPAGSLPTRRRTSNSPRSVRASSSARIPMPAILGRIGSGARITTRRVTAGERPTASTPASDPLGPEVELPRARGVDPGEKIVQSVDLGLQLGGLAVVVLVGREEIGHALGDELVFGKQPVPLERELARDPLQLAGAPARRHELGWEARELC